MMTGANFKTKCQAAKNMHLAFFPHFTANLPSISSFRVTFMYFIATAMMDCYAVVHDAWRSYTWHYRFGKCTHVGRLRAEVCSY